MNVHVNACLRACVVIIAVRTWPTERYCNYQWIIVFGRRVSTSY